MSLVEALIILLVLMLLTGVLAPSIWDWVKDSEEVKVKEDCEAIGAAVARLMRDVGRCLVTNSVNGCVAHFRADLLYGGGDMPLLDPLRAPVFPAGPFNDAANWDFLAPPNPGALTSVDTLEAQLVTNSLWNGFSGTHYHVPTGSDFMLTLPVFNLGWRGPYLSSPIGPDPWGNRYMVNTMFLAPLNPVPPPAMWGIEGAVGWNRPVICLSAGPNEYIETPFGGIGPPGFGELRGADDFIFVIQGASR